MKTRKQVNSKKKVPSDYCPAFSLESTAANPHVKHDNGARMEVFPRRPHRRSFFPRQAAELAKNYSWQETAKRLELACFGLGAGRGSIEGRGVYRYW